MIDLAKLDLATIDLATIDLATIDLATINASTLCFEYIETRIIWFRLFSGQGHLLVTARSCGIARQCRSVNRSASFRQSERTP
jgi:hypothetical protein